MKYILILSLTFLYGCELFQTPNDVRIKACRRFIEAAQKKDFNEFKRRSTGLVDKDDYRLHWDINVISGFWKLGSIPPNDKVIINIERGAQFVSYRFPFYCTDCNEDSCEGYLKFTFGNEVNRYKFFMYEWDLPHCMQHYNLIRLKDRSLQNIGNQILKGNKIEIQPQNQTDKK